MLADKASCTHWEGITKSEWLRDKNAMCKELHHYSQLGRQYMCNARNIDGLNPPILNLKHQDIKYFCPKNPLTQFHINHFLILSNNYCRRDEVRWRRVQVITKYDIDPGLPMLHLSSNIGGGTGRQVVSAATQTKEAKPSKTYYLGWL